MGLDYYIGITNSALADELELREDNSDAIKSFPTATVLFA